MTKKKTETQYKIYYYYIKKDFFKNENNHYCIIFLKRIELTWHELTSQCEYAWNASPQCTKRQPSVPDSDAGDVAVEFVNLFWN